jgi:hypothetical protein
VQLLAGLAGGTFRTSPNIKARLPPRGRSLSVLSRPGAQERFGDQAIAHSVPDPRCGGRSQSPRSKRGLHDAA